MESSKLHHIRIAREHEEINTGLSIGRVLHKQVTHRDLFRIEVCDSSILKRNVLIIPILGFLKNNKSRRENRYVLASSSEVEHVLVGLDRKYLGSDIYLYWETLARKEGVAETHNYSFIRLNAFDNG